MTFLGALRSTNRRARIVPASNIIYACAVSNNSNNNKYLTLIGPTKREADVAYTTRVHRKRGQHGAARPAADRRRDGNGPRACSGSQEQDTTLPHKQRNCSSSAALTPCRRVCSDQMVQQGQKTIVLITISSEGYILQEVHFIPLVGQRQHGRLYYFDCCSESLSIESWLSSNNRNQIGDPNNVL